MPYNGSGVFAVYTPGTPYVTGTTISSTVANNVNSDFSTGLSTAVTKDGQTTTTAAVPFAVGIRVALGSAASPSITPIGDTNTGNFSPGADIFATATGGTERSRTTLAGYTKFSDNGTYADATGAYNEFNCVGQFNLVMSNSRNTSGDVNIRSVLGANCIDTNSVHFRGDTNGVAKGYIYGNGTFGSATNTYGAIVSERRFKDGIELAGSQWEDTKFLASRMSKFFFKNDPSKLMQLGWIIDEVEPVCPGLIMESKNEETGEVTKGFKTSVALMKAMKALGEAMERIEALEAKAG